MATSRSVGMNIRDERYWLDRSEEAKAVAEMLTNEDARNSMLHVSDEYRKMAEARKRLVSTAGGK